MPRNGSGQGMAGKAGGKAGKPTIIIRREEVVEGGHHGGAWKVAYADFVTAMMAFFLLMWLLNATTQEQKRGLADYFSPNNMMARTTSGFGAPFGGLTPNIDGSMASDRGAVQMVTAPPHPVVDADEDEGDVPALASLARRDPGPSLRPNARDGEAVRAPPPQQQAPQAPTEAELRAELERREAAVLERAAEQIREAVRADPALADLGRQLAIDITPEGLRIQILDDDRRPMFPTGSATLSDHARALLAKVAPVLLRLPEQVSVAGHTDAAPYKGNGSNWNLSADRANTTRRLLVEAGLPEARLRGVAGHADRDLLLPGEPMAAANRRVAILVLRDAPAKGR